MENLLQDGEGDREEGDSDPGEGLGAGGAACWLPPAAQQSHCELATSL